MARIRIALLPCLDRSVKAIEAVTKQAEITHWIGRLNALGVPCAPINTIDKLMDHPQLTARNMIVQVAGEADRPVRTAGNPIKIRGFAEFDKNIPIKAPGLNEHREAILEEMMAGSGDYASPSAPWNEADEAELAYFAATAA